MTQIKHELKIQENYLLRLLDGSKKFEVRYNDRDYQVGDILSLKRESSIDGYTPNKTKNPTFDGTSFKMFDFKITHIHSGLGLESGFVILSLDRVEIEDVK